MPLGSFSASDMLLAERRRLERPLLAMIWLGILAFGLAEGQVFYILVGAVAVALNIWATQCSKEVYVSRLFVNLGVLLATGVLAIEVSQAPSLLVPMLGPLGHYLILIQLCKLFERKKNRDYVQMIALSALLMVAATLLCQELWFALIMAAYLALACYTTMVFTLKRGLDAAAAARLSTEPAPQAARRVAWNVSRDWPHRPVLRRAAWMLLAAVVAGTLTFLLTPRLGGMERALFDGASRASESGFAHSISLGRNSRVELSDREVMRLAIHAPQGADGPGGIYLKGKTFTAYANSRWSGPPAFISVARPPPPEELMSNLIEQEVSMDASLLPSAFAVYPAVRAQSGDSEVRIAADLGPVILASPASAARYIRYTVHSWPLPLTDGQRAYLASTRRVPVTSGQDEAVEVAPAVAELARRWCQDLLDQRRRQPERSEELDLAIARRLAGQLQANYRYSLEFDEADPDRDGVEDFLFHLGRGHCEYFASALTVMCSALGVRARLAAGFHVDEGNRFGEYYVVRQRDAHAWTEVFTPQTDWVIMDPTPAGGRSRTRPGGLWRRLGDFYGRLRCAWLERVVGYDSASREKLSHSLRDRLNGLTKALSAAAAAVRESFVNLLIRGQIDRLLTCLAIAVGAVGLALEALILGRLIRGSVRLRRAEARGLLTARHLKFLVSLVRLLERHGLRRQANLTPRELTEQAEVRLSLPSGTLGRLIDLYYRLRWGNCQPDEAELAWAQQQVSELSRQLRRRRFKRPS